MAVLASSIEDVYRRRHRVFRDALACVVGSYEVADDVVQEAFARALARRDQFRGEGALEAWIWRIAMRTALELRPDGATSPLDEVVDLRIVEPERDPELAEAVRRLPARRRLLIFLRYVADLSYADIALVCGIREGTVAATLTQARADLARELERSSDKQATQRGSR
jgi:RNA polymerase sigma factor (sigma-70 family)